MNPSRPPALVMALPRRGRQRGVTLLDSMIALCILAFGLLAMSRFQGRMVTQGTDARLRTTATQLADELISTMLVDTGNAGCYTVPAAGTCNSALARQTTDDWETRALAALPGTPTVTSTLANDQLTVVLTWAGKDVDNGQRSLTVVSDAR